MKETITKNTTEQGRERQRFAEGFTEAMFLDDAGERGHEHDHQQTDEADLRNMEAERQNQDQHRERLYPEIPALRGGAARRLLARPGDELLADALGQRGAITKPSKLLQQRAHRQPDGEHRHRHRCHLEEELDEIPAGPFADEEILRLADQRTHATQRRSHGRVHD